MSDKSACILYIEDDPALARLVQKALTRRGYAFEHRTNPGDGLERLRQGGIDVVALDHNMPGGTGLDVLAEMAQLLDPPPAIYVTGFGDTRVAVAALKAGAVDFVPKEVTGDFIELLCAAVEQALEQGRLRRQKERAERETREARDRAELLLREVNHRVANSLAMVAALAHMQTTMLADETAKAALREMQARINAIANVHRRLYTSDDVRYVEIGAYLTSLLEELEFALKATGNPHPVRLFAETIPIATDKVVSLGLMVTELVTNAYKYAYPSGAAGEIRIHVNRALDNMVVLTVEDDGIGWNGTGPARGTGLGTRIVKAMAKSLGSEICYDPNHNGTRILLRFSLD